MHDIYSSNDIFQTYFARAPEKQWVVESFNERLHDNEAATILDAGCHNGKLTQRIMQHCYNKLPEQTTLVGIDPCAEAITAFNQINFGNKITANGQAVTIEKFFETNTIKFDWIIASQSLYWTEDLKKIIHQMTEASQSTLIVLRGKFGIYQIQKKFSEFVGNPLEQLYHADDISNTLNAMSIPFERQDKQTYLALPDHHSPAFRHLLNFFMQTTDDDLSVAATGEITKYIHAEFNNQLRHDVSLFWI